MTASLPAITAELRNAFLPLLHTLEDENTFASYTYVIELLFSLVRMDASLRIEERDVFLRAFNFLANAQLAKLRQTREQQEQMTSLKQHLSIILAKCEMLRAICNERKEYYENKVNKNRNDDDSNENVCETTNESLDTDNETDVNDTTMPFVEVINDNQMQSQSSSPNRKMKTNTAANTETRKAHFVSSSSLEHYNEQDEGQCSWKENSAHAHDVQEIRTRLRYYFDKSIASVSAVVRKADTALPNTSLSLISEPWNVSSPTRQEEVSPLLTSNSTSSASLNRSPLDAYDQGNANAMDVNKSNAQEEADELTKRKDEFERFENAFWQFIGTEHVSSETSDERNNANTVNCTSVDVCVLLALFNCNSVRRFNEAVQRAAKSKNYPFASLDPRNTMSANVTLSNSSSLGYFDHLGNTSMHHNHHHSHNQMYALHYAKSVPNLMTLQQIDHKQWVKSSRFVHELVVSTMQLPLNALDDDFWQTIQVYILVLISYLLDVELPGTDNEANKQAKQQKEQKHESHCWSEKELEMFKFICPSLRLYTTSSANYLTLATPVLSSTHSLRSALANETNNNTNMQSSLITTAEATPNLSMNSSTVYFNNNNMSGNSFIQPHLNTSADSISSNISFTPPHLHNSSSQMQNSFFATSLTPMRFIDELILIQSRVTSSSSVALSSIDVILHGLLASLLCTIRDNDEEATNITNSHHHTEVDAKHVDNNTRSENHLEASNMKFEKPSWNVESDTHIGVHLPSMLRVAHTQENLDQNNNNTSSFYTQSELLTVPLHNSYNVNSKLNSTSNLTNISGEELHGAGLANYSFNSTCTYVTNYNSLKDSDDKNTCHALSGKTNRQLQLCVSDLCGVYKDVIEVVHQQEEEHELELPAEQLTYFNKEGNDNSHATNNKVNSNIDNMANTHTHYNLSHNSQSAHEQERTIMMMTEKSNKKQSSVADYLSRIIHQWLKQAEDSMMTLEHVAGQTRGEMTLLIFRVVSSLLDWVIPAAYAADGRLTMFYRKWVCDCYRLLFEEQLLEMFEKLLDQNVDKTTEGTITNEHEMHYMSVNDENDRSTIAHSSRHIHHHNNNNFHQKETSEDQGRGDSKSESKREENFREGHETLEVNSVHKKEQYELEHQREHKEKNEMEQYDKTITCVTNTSNNANGLIDHCGLSNNTNTHTYALRRENVEPISESVPHSPTVSVYSNVSHALHDPLALVVPGGWVEIIYRPRVSHYNSRDTIQTALSPCTQCHIESGGSVPYPHAFPCRPSSLSVSSPSQHLHPTHYPVHLSNNPLGQEHYNINCCCCCNNTQHHCHHHNTTNNINCYSTIGFVNHEMHYSTNNFALNVANMLLDQGTQVYSPCHFLLTRFIIAMIRNMNKDATRSLLRIFDAPLPHHPLQDGDNLNNNIRFSPITTTSSVELHRNSSATVPRIASRVYMSNTIMPTSTSSLSSSTSAMTSTHHNVNSSPSSPTYPHTSQHDHTNIIISHNVSQQPERHFTFTTTNTSRQHRQSPQQQEKLENNKDSQIEEHALTRRGMQRSYTQYAQSPLHGNTLFNNYTFMKNNSSGNSNQPYSVLPAQSFPASPLSEYRPYSPHDGHDTPHEAHEQSHELQRVFSPQSNYSVNSPTTRMHENNGERPVLLHHHRFRYPIVNSANDLIALYTHTLDDAALLLSPHDPIRASLMLNTIDCIIHNNKTCESNNTDVNANNSLESGIELLSNYLNDVREECVDETIYVNASLPASLQINSCASTKNTKSNHNNDSSTNNKDHDGKNTSNELEKNSSMNKSHNGKETNRNGKEDAAVEDETTATDKKGINTNMDNADYKDDDDSVMLTMPVNIPSWSSEQDKEQFTLVLTKLQKMYKQLKVECNR